MGNYVNNGVVTLEGNVDYDDAVREIATLVGVGKREDGRYYLADVVTAASINMMAKYKPQTTIDKPLNITDLDRKLDTWGLTWAEDVWEKNSRITLLREGLPLYNKADKWKRLKDFNGYDHYAKGLTIGTISPYDYNPDDAIIELGYSKRGTGLSLEEFKDIYSNVSLFTEFGILILSYTGFIIYKQVIANTYDGLLSWIYDGVDTEYLRNYWFDTEPHGYGYDGQFILYGKLPQTDTEYVYQQIGMPIIIKPYWEEESEAYITERFTPDTHIGTLTTGFDRSINDWQDSGEPIMFAQDDLLYFKFRADNPWRMNNLPYMYLHVLITVYEGTSDETTYSTTIFNIPATVDGPIQPSSQYIPAGLFSTGDLVIDLTNLYNKLGAISSLAPFEVTMQLKYKSQGIPLISNPTPSGDAYISSKFKLKLQCTGDTLNDPMVPINPDIRPVPPSWDQIA